MIHEISVSNFNSIRDEVTLDLRIPKTSPAYAKFPTSHSRVDIRLPTVIALFGANASGKSTILSALTRLVNFVCTSFDTKPGADIPGMFPFLDREHHDMPTTFRVEFDANWFTDEDEPTKADLLRYELVLGSYEKTIAETAGSAGPVWGRDHVIFEALYRQVGDYAVPKQRRRWQTLFEREEARIQRKIQVADWLKMKPSDSRLAAVRPNASVISTLAHLNVEWATRILQDMQSVQTNLWGRNRSSSRDPESLQALWKYYDDHPEVLDELNRRLRQFDTGIDAVEIQTFPGERDALFFHKALDGALIYEFESSGTQHIVSMLPRLLYTIQSGHIAVIDEFDADLHPTLIPEILRMFQDPRSNEAKGQLFLTAHNAQILSCLDKEEVVFVEKDEKGGTVARTGLDYQGLRRDVGLEDVYLSGVLGGLPKTG